VWNTTVAFIWISHSFPCCCCCCFSCCCFVLFCFFNLCSWNKTLYICFLRKKEKKNVHCFAWHAKCRNKYLNTNSWNRFRRTSNKLKEHKYLMILNHNGEHWCWKQNPNKNILYKIWRERDWKQFNKRDHELKSTLRSAIDIFASSLVICPYNTDKQV